VFFFPYICYQQLVSMPLRFTRFLFVFIFCLAGILAHGQKIATFQKIYHNSGGDLYSSGLVALPHGGFIISGIAKKVIDPTTLTDSFSIHLFRTDSLGKVLWSKIYKSPATDNITFNPNADQYVDLTLAPDGNVVIGTSSLEYPGVGLDPGYLFKIDLNGNVLWSNVYRGISNSPYAYSKTSVTTVVNDPHGGYLLGGMVAAQDNSINPIGMIIKTNATGSVTWAKGYANYLNYSQITNIVPSRDGGIILGGSFYLSNPQIIKTDNNGNPKWSKGFGFSGGDGLLNTIIELPDKSIYVFNSRSDNYGSQNKFTGNIQKLDSTGHLLWSKQYDFGLSGDYYGRGGLWYNGIFGYAFYDSTGKNITVSLKNIWNGIGMMRMDTSGKVVFSKIYNNVYNYRYNYNPSHWYTRLPSGGFALLGTTNTLDTSENASSVYNNDGNEYFLVKGDNSANTGGCNTRSLIPKVSNFPVYNFNPTIGAIGLSLSSDSFYGVTNYGIEDSVVCSPFVANFGADSVCLGFTTTFTDSTYFNPSNWKWDFGDTSSTRSDTSSRQNPTHQYKYPGTYYVKLVTSNGSEEDSITKIVKVYPLPASQLLAVSKISTSTTNGSVIIRWVTINKKNLAYNELFFSKDSKNFTAIGGHLPSGVDSFVQSGIDTKDSDYYYYLVTVDSCNTQSVQSPVSKTMTLIVSVGQLLHKLNWTPYIGFKVKQYQIQRFEKGQFVTIDSVPGTDTFSREFPAPCNYAMRYRIVAIGTEPFEVAWSDTMGRQAIDTIPSDPPIIQNARVLSGSSASLSFTGSDSADSYKFVIQRAVDGNWGTAGSILFTKPADSLQFIDNNINTVKNQICYTVITLDSCLNASSSDTICLQRLTGSGLFCAAKAQLNWPAFHEPPSLPDSLFIYRSLNDINFNKKASLSPKLSGYADTAVSVGQRYYYTMSTLYKSGMISYSDTISITPTIIPEADSAQIVYATVIKSDEINGAVYIKWERAMLNDTNARGYYLYSFNNTNGKYALLKDITDLNDTTFINSNINTIKDVNKYYVLTYNVCDVGINSNIHRTVLLNVLGKNLSEQLNWINYLGVPVKNYSIYKSVDGGTQNLVKNIGTDSSYLDSNISCNHNITYQIQAILSNGEISFSDSITVKSYDSIRPVTKPIVVATVIKTGVSDGKIQLNWNAATDNNLLGYNVYRSVDGLYWSLIIGHWPGTSLIDSGLDTYDQSYYYKIQPVDSCGNLGPFTIYHETIHLKASASTDSTSSATGRGYIQLSWNGYAGWPVKKYLLYRDGVLIDSFTNNQLAYKDSSIICHTIYQYLIKAIDSVNDTIISASNTDSARAANHIPPQKVYIKTVTVSKPNKAATITWAPSSSYDVKNYYIYRKSAIDGSMRLIDSTTSTSYSDSSETITEPDCYYIFARDNCGNQSDGSNQGCIITLTAKNQPGYNDVSWNSYQTWYDGVQSYNVYKNEDGTGWQLIGTTSSVQINQFKDSKLGDSTIDFCYQVEAIENPGQYNQLSRSTVECVHQDATVFIPNSFTPYNQDGLNDFFGPKGIYIKTYDMKIYNRWGEQIYNSQVQPSQGGAGNPTGWDGTYKGQYVQQGIYIYLITVTDYNRKQSYFKGTVTMFE